MDTILIVEDEALIRWSIGGTLRAADLGVMEAGTLAEAERAVRDEEIDLILLDQMLPGGRGTDLFPLLRELGHPAPVIILTAVDTSQAAVDAMKLGAFDYLTKPVGEGALLSAVRRGLEDSRLKRRIALQLRRSRNGAGFQGMVGSSEIMRNIFSQIARVAASPTTTLLITGESGTGKELAAAAVHRLSGRHAAPFRAVNCSALAESLIESELFGHEKGAFTDARSQHRGLFETADGGTLFLDEIGDMPPPLQAKLLRVLEEKSFRRVGGVADIAVDVRIIAATNRDLEQRVADGSFRADLFYRLDVARIHLPPLRERGEDVCLLADWFLHKFNQKFRRKFRGVSAETRELFLRYSWPGNVRELGNMIERAVVLEEGEYLHSRNLRIAPPIPPVPEEKQAVRPEIGAGGVSLADLERRWIIEALEKAGRNQSRAARLLNISRDALRYKMKKFHLFGNPDADRV